MKKSRFQRPKTWSVFLVALWIYIVGPGVITGKFFPVIDSVAIEARQDVTNPEWVWVSGSFVKIRENCNPLRVEWFLGDRDGEWTPIEYVWGKSEIQQVGEQHFDNWRVRAAPPKTLLNNTYANHIHQCGFVFTLDEGKFRFDFPWETATHFWR